MTEGNTTYANQVIPRGAVVNIKDCSIVVSEFELQSLSGLHIWTNTIGKGANPRIL